jgi:hypothetical protein
MKPKDENGPAAGGDEDAEEVGPPVAKFMVSGRLNVAK